MNQPVDTLVATTELKINEIFYSIQGESRFNGLPTVFIRLTGCPLRCQYCDTEYAFYEGKKMSIEEILAVVNNYKTQFITVTGGEPLAQKQCLSLLSCLCDQGFTVSLETSGAIDIADVDKRVVKIMDIKTPASGEVDKNRLENLAHLSDQDELKFVICNIEDYNWSKDFIKQHNLAGRFQILFSSSHQELSPTDLADWIIKDQLTVRMQLQMHKYLWGDKPGV